MALSYKQKMAQATREAKATVVALVVVVAAWCVLGFGLAGTGLFVAGMPLWALAGTVGTWAVALGACCVLGYRVFQDVDLDGDPPAAPAPAAPAPAAPAPDVPASAPAASARSEEVHHG